MDHNQVVSIDSGGHRERVHECIRILVERHHPLVLAIARKLKRGLPPSFELDDLIAAGEHALLSCAAKYQPAEHNETPFAGYARSAIRGAMLDMLRPRKFADATMPGLEEAAEPWAAPVIEISIDAGRLRSRVLSAVSRLTTRQQRVLVEYYGSDEPSLAVVGERMGMSARRACELHTEAIDELRRLLRTA